MRMIFAGALLLLTTGADARWEKTEETSPLDDSKTVRIIRWADESYISRYRQTRLIMVVQCQKRDFSVAFYFGGEFLRTHPIAVDYRIDKRPAQRKLFGVSSNHEWAIASSGRDSTIEASVLFDELVTGQSVYVQAGGSLGEVVHGKFTLTGLREAVEPVQRACSTPINAPKRK